MYSYDKLNKKKETILQQMVEVESNVSTDILTEITLLTIISH